MNTKQLAALWYGGLAVSAVLIYQAGEYFSTSSLVGVILLVTGLAVYTFRQHPEAKKTRLFWIVTGPLVLGTVVVSLVAFLEYRSSTSPGSSASSAAAVLSFREATITGSIRNSSERILGRLVLHVQRKDEAGTVVDEGDFRIQQRVPVGEVRSFEAAFETSRYYRPADLFEASDIENLEVFNVRVNLQATANGRTLACPSSACAISWEVTGAAEPRLRFSPPDDQPPAR